MKRQHILFCIDKTRYAVDIAEVKTIVLNDQPITPLPQMPREFLGKRVALNLLWDLLDLRDILHQQMTDATEKNKILLLERERIGFLIDDVENIREIDEGDVQQTNSVGITSPIANLDDGIAVIISLEKVVTNFCR